jgi:hypothetical protein
MYRNGVNTRIVMRDEEKLKNDINRPVVDLCVYLPQQQTSGLRGSRDSVRFDDSRLPHAGLEVVRNVLVENVHTVPDAVLSVLLAQLVQDVGGVEAGIVAQLPRNHLEGLGHSADDELLLAGDGAAVVAKILRQLHVDGSAARHHRVVLHGSPRKKPRQIILTVLDPNGSEIIYL